MTQDGKLNFFFEMPIWGLFSPPVRARCLQFRQFVVLILNLSGKGLQRLVNYGKLMFLNVPKMLCSAMYSKCFVLSNGFCSERSHGDDEAGIE